MKQILLSYIEDRSLDSKIYDTFEGKSSSVIAISREHGCPASEIANLLSLKLTEYNESQNIKKPWDWISKEIIESTAKGLKLSETLTKELTKYKNRSFLENLILFFTEDYYPSNIKIKNTIAKLIYLSAQKSNIIIVGRAAEYVTKNFKKAIHIKLKAPLDWRAECIGEKEGLNISEAKKEIIKMDKRRENFRRFFDENYDENKYFHITFNCSKLSKSEIVESILNLAIERNIL